MAPINEGVNRRAIPIRGWIKTAELEFAPKFAEKRVENMTSQLPIKVVHNHRNKMDAARMRKSIYRKGGVQPTYQLEYTRPRIVRGVRAAGHTELYGSRIPLWQEKRMILYNKVHASKWTRNLTYTEQLKAVQEFFSSPHPFDVAKLKGSHIATPDHCLPFLAEEWEALIDWIQSCQKIEDMHTLRADVMSPIEVELWRIRQASALNQRRVGGAAVDAVTKKYFGGLLAKARKPENPDSILDRLRYVIDEDDELDEPPPKRARAMSDEPDEIPDIINLTFDAEEGEELTFAEVHQTEDNVERLLFMEDAFEPTLPDFSEVPVFDDLF
jgi:hypothetical protein